MIARADPRLSMMTNAADDAPGGCPTNAAGSRSFSTTRATGSFARAETMIAPSTDPPDRYRATRSVSRSESTMSTAIWWSASDSAAFAPSRMPPMLGSSTKSECGSCTMNATDSVRCITRWRAAVLGT